MLNPKLFGHHLLMRAKRLEQHGHLAAAAEACTAASKYYFYREQAHACRVRLARRMRRQPVKP